MSRLMDIKLRRGTAAAWTSANPTLDSGEPGWETDTRRLKFGDGVTPWTSLGYFAGGGGSGSLELIYDYTVTGSDKTSIDTGADAAMAGSNDWTNGDVLEVFILARTDKASVEDNVAITVNNDTGSNYDYILESTAGSPAANAAFNGNAQAKWAITVAGTSAAASYPASMALTIPAYAGTDFKKTGTLVNAIGDTAAANYVVQTYGVSWRSTAAITRLAASGIGGQKLKVGSRLLIYKRRTLPYVAPTGNTELVYRYTVTGSDKASIDTSVDTRDAGSGDWTNGDMLEVVIMGRTDETAVNSTVSIQFNGDTSTANYIYELVRGNNTTASAVRNLTIPGVQIPIFAGASHASGAPSITTVQIPAYTETTFNKIMTMLNGAPDVTTAGSNYVEAEVGSWLSTAAITSLKILVSSGSSQKFKVGTQILIYKRLRAGGVATTGIVDGGSA